MKNFTTALCCLAAIACSFAQSNHKEVAQLAEAEQKSAFALANFAANPNTANYDVTHQTLEFNVNPSVYNISGKVTTTFTALQNMSTLTFDLTNQLTVSSVIMNGNSLAFTQNSNNELVITLPTTLSTGSEGIVIVNYQGAPSQNEQAFVTSTHNGTPVLWTLSEPYGAKDWWPCKQDLNDKIGSIDVYITAPTQYVSVSNGLEQGQVNNGNGTKTTHFTHNYPIPAYLVAIAVTNYTVYTEEAGTAPNTFPIVNYLYPETLEQSQEQVGQTPTIMDFYEATFETYPFHNEKYGHAQCGFGGGMEHTTVSFMGGFSRGLIAHELAHQWFGDKITCGAWNDIWLNEGFATYLSGMVIEHLDGSSAFKDWRVGMIDYIVSEPNGSVYVPESEIQDEGRIFSSRLSYDKGAIVLNMLRFKLGNDVFLQGIKNYLADTNLAYAYAVTPDLQSHLEDASGLDLEEFFNDWVYGEGYPSYSISANGSNGNYLVTINQTQSDDSVSFYEMPVPIRFYDAEGNTFDTVLDNTTNGQQFIVSVPFTAVAVEFDPDRNIIAYNSTTILGSKTLTLANASLYPNPANSMLNLQLPQGIEVQKATFYNTLGQKVLETADETVWNVSGLAKGVHFITVETNKGTTQLKFIKE